MTEQDWLTSEDPQAMLGLGTETPGMVPVGASLIRIGDRKLRLVACAWARTLPPNENEGPTDEADHQAAIVAAEAMADGENSSITPIQEARYYYVAWAPPEGCRGLCEGQRYSSRYDSGAFAGSAKKLASWAALLRDIVGNPFRPVRRWNVILDGLKHGRDVGQDLDEAWLTPAVRSLAQAAYDDRRPDGSLDPVTLGWLADALEEAGCPAEVDCRCENAIARAPKRPGGQMLVRICPDCRNTTKKPHPILAHLRERKRRVRVQPVPGDGSNGDPYWVEQDVTHVRGCWAVDLILGRD